MTQTELKDTLKHKWIKNDGTVKKHYHNVDNFGTKPASEYLSKLYIKTRSISNWSNTNCSVSLDGLNLKINEYMSMITFIKFYNNDKNGCVRKYKIKKVEANRIYKMYIDKIDIVKDTIKLLFSMINISEYHYTFNIDKMIYIVHRFFSLMYKKNLYVTVFDLNSMLYMY